MLYAFGYLYNSSNTYFGGVASGNPLKFTCTTSGTYYINISSYSKAIGNYSISINKGTYLNINGNSSDDYKKYSEDLLKRVK
jgi:hypothetical protein